MGCWNKTCGLSRLPIIAGDKVYVVPLMKQTFTTRCYSSAFWVPGYHWMAEYNDYGAGEKDNGLFLPWIMDYLSKKINELEEGDSSSDVPVKREGFNVETFYNAIHGQRLTVNSNYYFPDVEMDFVMIRKDVVDHLKETFKFKEYDGAENDPYHHYMWKDVVESIPACVDYIIDKTLHIEDDFVLKYMNKIDIQWEVKHKNRSLLALRYLPDGGNDFHQYFRSYGIDEIFIGILKSIRECDVDKFDSLKQVFTEIAYEMLEMSFIQCVSNSTRHLWMPGGHEGSQDQDWQAYDTLANTVKHIVNEQLSQYEDY